MVSIPKDFQDYDDEDPNVKKRQSRWDFWNVLKKLRKEYTEDGTNFNADEFIAWVDQKYGLKLVLNFTGITDEYTITDEQKYIFFRLKYD